MVMRSVTPWMPWRSVSSAMRNASSMLVFLSTISSRRSLGMTMSVSTFWDSRSTPCSAWLRRVRPSKRERLGDDADGQRADLLARDLGDDGRGARARAAAFAGGDEDHVRLGQRLADLRAALLGRLAAHLGIRRRRQGRA